MKFVNINAVIVEAPPRFHPCFKTWCMPLIFCGYNYELNVKLFFVVLEIYLHTVTYFVLVFVKMKLNVQIHRSAEKRGNAKIFLKC